MSTLTSSPSPAASPRQAFNIRGSAQYTPSSRVTARSPRTFSTSANAARTASSPRRANAPPTAAASKYPDIPRAVQREAAASGAPRMVDVGTQYSPEGLPPTAGRKIATAAERPSGSHKRKEPSKSPAMSTQAYPPAPPAEPELRETPTAATQTNANANATATTELPERPAEPQHEEARSTSHRSSSASAKRARPEPEQIKIMPLKYETCDPKELGYLISNMLMELIRLNDQIPLRDGRLTRFHSRAPPGISTSDYLQRLIQHATLSPPILLSMVYYIDRLCALYPAFTINSLTVHRFLITSATVAAKGLSDSFWTNPTYARIGGIPVGELATLELEFLIKVQWKIVPKPEVLEEYYMSLVDRSDMHDLEKAESSSGGGSSSEEDGDDDKMEQD